MSDRYTDTPVQPILHQAVLHAPRTSPVNSSEYQCSTTLPSVTARDVIQHTSVERLLIASKWSFFRYCHALSVNCAGPPTEIHFPPVGLFGWHPWRSQDLAHIRMFAKDAQTCAMDSSSFHARTIPSKGLSEKNALGSHNPPPKPFVFFTDGLRISVSISRTVFHNNPVPSAPALNGLPPAASPRIRAYLQRRDTEILALEFTFFSDSCRMSITYLLWTAPDEPPWWSSKPKRSLSSVDEPYFTTSRRKMATAAMSKDHSLYESWMLCNNSSGSCIPYLLRVFMPQDFAWEFDGLCFPFSCSLSTFGLAFSNPTSWVLFPNTLLLRWITPGQSFFFSLFVRSLIKAHLNSLLYRPNPIHNLRTDPNSVHPASWWFPVAWTDSSVLRQACPPPLKRTLRIYPHRARFMLTNPRFTTRCSKTHYQQCSLRFVGRTRHVQRQRWKWWRQLREQQRHRSHWWSAPALHKRPLRRCIVTWIIREAQHWTIFIETYILQQKTSRKASFLPCRDHEGSLGRTHPGCHQLRRAYIRVTTINSH